ncbi:MAG: hypothetical protein OYL97_20100 [Candidatus Poribacteria bacterium]|nr:hypothetical protein [Candidatus Poribacteria bacterium]
MNIRFNTDRETGLPHIYKHGVDEDEVEDVLLNPGEDRTENNNSRVAIGQTRAGRYLRVIYLRDPQPNSVQCFPLIFLLRIWYPVIGTYTI